MISACHNTAIATYVSEHILGTSHESVCTSQLGSPFVSTNGHSWFYNDYLAFAGLSSGRRSKYYSLCWTAESSYQLSISSSSSASATVSKRPRAIPHIGHHKTSTTYIQSKLCKAQDQLAQEVFVIPVAKSCPEEEQTQCYVKPFHGRCSTLTRQYGNGQQVRLFFKTSC